MSSAAQECRHADGDVVADTQRLSWVDRVMVAAVACAVAQWRGCDHWRD
jgi:hypothetical protein